MALKHALIEKIIKEPWAFTRAEFLFLVNLTTGDPEKKEEVELNFYDLRKMIIRIFDINENTLRQQSDATRGVLGYLNKESTERRRNRYFRLIDNGFREAGQNTTKKLIVAEGDSWFQFPFFVSDIIDWLNREPNYAVYSIAYGGDWFTNILYDEKYVEELSIHKPDVFLISGGGNDFVGSNRLAAMVKHRSLSFTRFAPDYHTSPFYNDFLAQETEETKRQIERGYEFILPAFFSFLWTIKAQYYKLFCRLQESGKYPGMKIITQGYDYVIPSFAIHFEKWYALQPVVNWMAGTGGWLKRPLMIQAIKDREEGICILKAMIAELNYLFADLACNFGFDQVYHIDCRGTAEKFGGWWDEIHLHSEGYRAIAAAYRYCINNSPPDKVIRVISVA